MRVEGIPFLQGRNYNEIDDVSKRLIIIHNTSNNGTARQEAEYAARQERDVSAHFYVDDSEIYQSLDTDVVAWHAGWKANQHSIGIEIAGYNKWTRQQWLDQVAWNKLGALLTTLCAHYEIPARRVAPTELKSNPHATGLCSHHDTVLAWHETDHTDPGGNFPWDKLFASIAREDEMELKDELYTREDGNHRSIGSALASIDTYAYRLRSVPEQVRALVEGQARLEAAVAALAKHNGAALGPLSHQLSTELPSEVKA